jgi:replicative DNA helicase
VKYNWEVERSLLGGLMLDASQLSEIAERLRPEDFHRPQHTRLFELLKQLAEERGSIDVVSVMDDIGRRDAFEEYGGAAYVAALPNACASVENLPDYAERVREHALRRNLVLAAQAITEQVKSGEGTLASVLDDAERTIFQLTQLSGPTDWYELGEVVDEQFSAIQERAQNPGEVTGIPTGFVDLDRKLAGLQKSDLIILAARPAMGKTAFVLNIALNAALKGGVAVGVFSLEMSRQQLATRMLTAEARVDAGKVRTGSLDMQDFRALTEAVERLHGLPIEIDDTPGLTIQQLRSKARRLKTKRPDLGLIIVDYLQIGRAHV